MTPEQEAVAEMPGEAEVKAYGREYPGNPGKNIPPAMPDLWVQRYYDWRAMEQGWPLDWRAEMVRRFEYEHEIGRPEARGKKEPAPRRVFQRSADEPPEPVGGETLDFKNLRAPEPAPRPNV